jgi:hypothetical protein
VDWFLSWQGDLFQKHKGKFWNNIFIRELLIAVGKNVCLCFGDVPLKEW